jgi:hypothetical protein
MGSFIPVKPDEKKEERNKFPGVNVLTLTKDPKEGHKMLSFNEDAAKALGLTEENNMVSIIRGYDSEEMNNVYMYLYLPEDEAVEYVEDNGKLYKRKAAKVISMNTLNFKSIWMYDELEKIHSNEDVTQDRHFVLEKTDDKTHWKLSEMHIMGDEVTKEVDDDMIVVVPPVQDESVEETDETFTTKGSDVDIHIN